MTKLEVNKFKASKERKIKSNVYVPTHPNAPSCPQWKRKLGKWQCYLQAAGFDPDSHILGITAFVFGLQGKWALIVILTVRVFFSILKKKIFLKWHLAKQSIAFLTRRAAPNQITQPSTSSCLVHQGNSTNFDQAGEPTPNRGHCRRRPHRGRKSIQVKTASCLWRNKLHLSVL